MFLRILILTFIFSLCQKAAAQSLNFGDGFEDGNFTENPEWSGTDSLFVVVNGSPNHFLQLNGDRENGGVAYLSTPASEVTGYWDLYINLDGFSPSSSNRADIFLMSDQADLTGPINGYALRAGENGSGDVFKIVRYDAGSEAALVLAGTTDISSGGDFRVRVHRHTGGDWSLEVAAGYDGPPVAEGGSAVDNTYASASHFGVRVTYTSTRYDKFYFDFKIDLPPFIVTKVHTDSSAVDVFFNRPYDPLTAEPADFWINKEIGEPVEISFPQDDVIRLHYNNLLRSDEYTLSVKDITDLNGVLIDPGTGIPFIVFGTFESGDIIVNEFMYDYAPGQSEYLELYNRTDKYLNLQHWQLADGSGTYTIASDTLSLPDYGYLVISADTAALFNTYGHRPYWKMSSFPSLNNSGDMIKITLPEGTAADSLVYSPDWGGTDVSLERRSDSVSAIYKENWGDSPHLLSGTPGKANEVAADTVSPSITGLNIEAHQLTLGFNERLDELNAQNISHYSLQDESQISISSATLIAADSVQLEPSVSLQNNTQYTLSVNGPSDIFGNTVTGYDTAFTYYEISPVDSADVYLSEFMYDPPSGGTEYIELYNPTNKSLDLQNWTISDNTAGLVQVVSSEYILPPQSYIVLTTDETLRLQFPEIALIEMGGRFPSLNNGGDAIVLRNAEGMVLDSLFYDSDWGGNEVSLERRSTQFAAVHAENFGDSPNGFGTPGKENEVAEDITPPEWLDVSILDPRSIQLVFSEYIDPVEVLNAENFVIHPQIDIQKITANNKVITLSFSEKLSSGVTYDLEISNLSDLFGNIMPATRKAFRYLHFSSVSEGDLVINEFLYNPSDRIEPFVEIYNKSGKNIDLSGWKLGDASGTAAIPPGAYISQNEYVIFSGTKDFSPDNARVYILAKFPNLNLRGDALYLQNQKGLTVDSLYYSELWDKPQPGQSVERMDPEAASNDPANWTLNESTFGHSAGSENSVSLPDDAPPAIIFANRLNDSRILARFSEFIRVHSDTEFKLNDTKLTVESFSPSQGDEILLSGNFEMQSNKSGDMLLGVSNLSDYKGNVTSSASIPVARSLNKGDLVINEIMYQPLADPDDRQPDQGEYIELRNTRDAAISLEGIAIKGNPDENGESNVQSPVSSRSGWVPANGFVLLYSDEKEHFGDSRIAAFFEMEENNPSSILRFDQSSLGLRARGDAVFVVDSSGAVIDSVMYDQDWHNPNIIDTRGISLERISPLGPSNEPSNWSSNTHISGGTPDAENSIYQIVDHRPQQEGISFSPNPFSPDDDGNDDHLFINYQLDGSDYLATVRIYDRYGRMVRKLADGTPVGFTGSLIWDGRKDDGTYNRIGIYIIVFEAVNSSSGKRKAFKKTAVLARRLR